MRIRATCDACDRDFLFFELRGVDTRAADRCPNCGELLGVRSILAVRSEQALAIFIGSLEELARHYPNFTVRAGSVLRPLEDALAALTVSPAARRRRGSGGRGGSGPGRRHDPVHELAPKDPPRTECCLR